MINYDIGRMFSLGRVEEWCKRNLNRTLFENQIPIVRKVSSPSVTNLAVVGVRQGGKSDAVINGALMVADTVSKYKWTVWGPKEAQAKRLIGEMTATAKDSPIGDRINWNRSTSERIIFKRGSRFDAFSASPDAETEGTPSDGILVDECHRVTDTGMASRVIPTLGASRMPKLILLGMPKYKHFFYNAFRSPTYEKIRFTWKDAPILFRGACITVDGVVYPKYILDIMPYTVKQKYFPNHPEMWTSGGIPEYDWETQYEVNWLEALGLLLDEDGQAKLRSGDFDYLEQGIPGEVYYAGLDWAGGALHKNKTKDPDFTHLSIGRVRNGIKEKCAAFQWQGDLYLQKGEILEIILNRFKVKKLLADYGNQGAPIIDEWRHTLKNKIEIDAVMYEWKEENSGKNYKNAMFDKIWFEIKEGRFKYPRNYSQHPVLKKSVDEWENLERYDTGGVNATIEGGEGYHDDGCNADAILNWNMLMGAVEGKKRNMAAYFPGLVRVPSMTEARTAYFEGRKSPNVTRQIPDHIKRMLNTR